MGDSLGMVVQGRPSTLGVTLDQMIYHAEMVARGAELALVVADLPFGSDHSPEQAVASATRFLKETLCQAVKIEGGRKMAPTIRAVVDAEIPVMGHVGLTPQSVRRFGGFKVQRDADQILDDARAVAEAGAFAVVLECVPAELAARITREVPIATIGIGAGAGCDGQVLVTPDLLGLFDGFQPKFVRRYAASATRSVRPCELTSPTSSPAASRTRPRVSAELPALDATDVARRPCRRPDPQALRPVRGRDRAARPRRRRAAAAPVPGLGGAGDGKAIRREWRARNFAGAAPFFHEVASLAEAEGHHPDLHLTGYREVAIEPDDPRRRRAHGERLHPRGEDRRDPFESSRPRRQDP